MRNVSVEKSVDLLLDLVDKIVDGKTLGAPAKAATRALFDDHVASHGGSVRLACAFLTAYSIVDKQWDHQSVPTGVRGTYGDKKLATSLTFRHVTFHKNITAFGENLGWKGAVKQFNLSQDARFSTYLSGLRSLNAEEKKRLLHHVAWRIATSRVVPQALPPLPGSYLSYARSLSLCESLLAVPSEGHIQQFLVAAFLETHRKRFGHRVETHHPHASDKFDVPRTIREGRVVVRGEVVLEKAVFQERYAASYANPRNTAAGKLRDKKGGGADCENLSFIAYSVISDGGPDNEGGRFNRLRDLGFRVLPWDWGSVDDVCEAFRKVNREAIPYEIDGMVVRVADISLQEQLGELNMRPRGQIAWKFGHPTGITRVNGVRWQVGTTGRVVPVASVDPVSIGGVTITSVSLHNLSLFRSLKLRQGSRVLVSRRNEVIPYIEQNLDEPADQ